MATGYKGLRMSGNLKQLNMGNMKVQKGIDFIELAERGLITEPHTPTSTIGTGHKKGASGNPIGAAASSTSVDMGNILKVSTLSYDYGEVSTAAEVTEINKWAVRRAVAASMAVSSPSGGSSAIVDWTGTVTTFNQLNPYTGSLASYFGTSVATGNNYYLGGGHGTPHPDGSTSSGEVIVYDASDDSILHTLVNPNVNRTPLSDNFGRHAAIDGNKALIVAYGESSERDGYEMGGVGRGYYYDLETGVLLHAFEPTENDPSLTSNSQYRYFYPHVADTKGNYSILGSNSVGYDHPDQAWVYDNTTGNLVYRVDDTYSTNSVDLDFATDVAINDTHFVISMPGAHSTANTGNSMGFVVVHTLSDGLFARTIALPSVATGTLLARASNDNFGKTMAIDGNKLAIAGPGKENVFVFDVTDGSHLHTVSTASGKVIRDIDISGNYVAVSYTDWTKVDIIDITDGSVAQSLVNPDADPSSDGIDYFGITISFNGGNLVVGASGEDSVGHSRAGAIYRFTVS